jgi:uncharacterized membrane protein
MNLEETQGHRPETAPGDGPRRRFASGVVTQVQARVMARLLAADEPDAIALAPLVEAGVITPSQAAVLAGGRAGLNGDGRSSGGKAYRPRSAGSTRAWSRGDFRPRLSVSAERLGVVLSAVAFAALIWGGVALATDLLVSPRKPLGTELVDAIRVAASLLVLIGGRRMYRGAEHGKPLVLTGLALFALMTAAANLRRLADPATVAVLLSCVVFYYLAATSRFKSSRSGNDQPHHFPDRSETWVKDLTWDGNAPRSNDSASQRRRSISAEGASAEVDEVPAAGIFG